MKLKKQILTENDCYKDGDTIKPRGVMVHSTGKNNPKVSRYVPGNAEIGYNTGGNHWNQPDKLCVHAFIGKFADGSIGTVQTLPWNYKAWHCGHGKKGSGNDTHIAFEICEDGLKDPDYFQAVYQEAAELTAHLCELYNLDPLADGVVICHQEGHQRGIASNHGDVLHWFPKFGKTMDNFRANVARIMKGEDETVTYEQWKGYMERYRKELGEKKAESWAVPFIDTCIDAGIMTERGGTIDRPGDFVTRQEAAVMAANTLEAAEK